jgi:hypothetical protein
MRKIPREMLIDSMKIFAEVKTPVAFDANATCELQGLTLTAICGLSPDSAWLRPPMSLLGF